MNKIKYLTLIALGLYATHGLNATDMSSPPDSLVVDTSGKIGIGTSAPDETLHILRDDGNASVLIQETGLSAGTPTQNRNMLRMINNGGSNFSFQDSSTSEGWQFAMTNNGDMAISKEFTGGSEFIVQKTGRVRMGPGPTTNFDLRSNGDLLIPNGTVSSQGVLLTSSKETKEEFKPVDNAKILDKVASLEITNWKFKTDAADAPRHIGPMAEEFEEAFNLGTDGKTIGVTDVNGIALASIQELNKQILEKDSRISELEERLEKLEKHLIK